jgi:hypothetical protein
MTAVIADARDQVGRVLEVLAAGLAPFVEQRMRNAKGPEWFGALNSYRSSSEEALKDPRFLLKAMTGEWDVFSPPLSRMERSLVFELRETANRWAHYEPFTSDDVDRALDSVERLLAAVDAKEAATVRQAKAELRRSRYVDDDQERGSGPKTGTLAGPGEVRGAAPSASGLDDRGMPEGTQNWRLILAAARALTTAGDTPFSRIGVYEWIWDRSPRSEHDRPSLDPTFQGMVSNATGGPPSAGGTPLLRVSRGLFVLADSASANWLRKIVNDPSHGDPRPEAPQVLAITLPVRDSHTRSAPSATAWPGHPISAADLARAGFQPLELGVRSLDVDMPSGRGCEWTTIGEVPQGPGLYAFTVGDDREMRVTYVGRTEHLWMVTRGRLPGGAGRGGQRYGSPRYAGATRQRVNILVAEQVRAGRLVRHWVRLCQAAALRVEEERLISGWDLRRVGWNRG